MEYFGEIQKDQRPKPICGNIIIYLFYFLWKWSVCIQDEFPGEGTTMIPHSSIIVKKIVMFERNKMEWNV